MCWWLDHASDATQPYDKLRNLVAHTYELDNMNSRRNMESDYSFSLKTSTCFFREGTQFNEWLQLTFNTGEKKKCSWKRKKNCWKRWMKKCTSFKIIAEQLISYAREHKTGSRAPQEHKRQNYVIKCNIIGQWNVGTSVWNALSLFNFEQKTIIPVGWLSQSPVQSLRFVTHVKKEKNQRRIQLSDFQSVTAFQWVKLEAVHIIHVILFEYSAFTHYSHSSTIYHSTAAAMLRRCCRSYWAHFGWSHTHAPSLHTRTLDQTTNADFEWKMLRTNVTYTIIQR